MNWKWCLVDENNNLLSGWQKVEGLWYFLNTNGVMATGWIKDKEKWYYLNGEGVMLCNCTLTIKEKTYTFNSDGSLNENILSDAGADYIGRWEGFWAKADYDHCYPGIEKYITIGYGTTYEARPDAFPNGIDSTCTIEEARTWLIDEGKEKAEAIKNDLDSRGIKLEQHELDALISFAYNCGAGQSGLLGSTLYKNVVAGVRDSETITSNFVAWNRANGKVEPGLTRRRNSEAALFLNADYTGNV